MRYRRLGASELEVSEISLGTWLSYGEGPERQKLIACIHRALDLGVNLFDTANVYGFGEAERLLAEALRGSPRHSYLTAPQIGGERRGGDRSGGPARRRAARWCGRRDRRRGRRSG